MIDARGVRRGYWVRWTFGVLTLSLLLQALGILLAAAVYPLLLPLALVVAGVALGVAMLAVLVAPAVIQVPHETRLRLEEWVASDRTPDEAAG